MDGLSRTGEALEGWGQAAQELVAEWTSYASKLTTKTESGSYAAEDGSADFATGLQLVVSSFMKLGVEALDSISILTEEVDPDEDSGVFLTSPSGQVRTLAIPNDLVSVTGTTLPAAKVTLHPATLKAGEQVFRLEVATKGVKARIYDGEVVATATDGSTETIAVKVTIG
ncbi:MAG: hypothetical protein M3Z03_02680 [Actinomycetota bacterium]|nr:hypothetical protein [Actinomycetota bacterium]